MKFLLWLLPLLVLLLSFVSFRLNSFKSVKYKIYFFILFIAFLLDLMHISFSYDMFDTIRFLLITFIIADVAWKITTWRKPVLRGIALCLAILLFGWTYFSWAIDGPNNNGKHWNKPVISSYVNHKNRTYVLKEQYSSDLKSVKRLFLLSKIKKVNLFEEEVRTFTLPEGYNNSEFNYKWSNTLNGVRLDLINGKDTIWTLGEGF